MRKLALAAATLVLPFLYSGYGHAQQSGQDMELASVGLPLANSIPSPGAAFTSGVPLVKQGDLRTGGRDGGQAVTPSETAGPPDSVSSENLCRRLARNTGSRARARAPVFLLNVETKILSPILRRIQGRTGRGQARITR